MAPQSNIFISFIVLPSMFIHGQHTQFCEMTDQTDETTDDRFLRSIDGKLEQLSYLFSSWFQSGDKHVHCPPSIIPIQDCDNRVARDCAELRSMGYRNSGVYTIYPMTLDHGLDVYCDMKTRQEGWVVIQRRQDGSVNFTRKWQDYRDGFGDLNGEFWLGNKYIHALTAQRPYRLRVDTVDFENNQKHADYSFFKVENEENLFRLFVDTYTYSGTAGDGFRIGNSGAYFSTIDMDNDGYGIHCASTYNLAGWWYVPIDVCGLSHLNNPYPLTSERVANGKGLTWNSWNILLRFTEMKLA